MSRTNVSGFAVETDLAYDLEHHMWVQVLDSGSVRIGMDPLGLETSGTLSQLALEAGGDLARGDAFGTLEAEKFVGPLIAPLSGHVAAVNDGAIGDPGLVERDPYGDGWLIELQPTDPDDELALLVRGETAIVQQFEQRIRQYRLEGVLSE